MRQSIPELLTSLNPPSSEQQQQQQPVTMGDNSASTSIHSNYKVHNSCRIGALLVVLLGFAIAVVGYMIASPGGSRLGLLSVGMVIIVVVSVSYYGMEYHRKHVKPATIGNRRISRTRAKSNGSVHIPLLRQSADSYAQHNQATEARILQNIGPENSPMVMNFLLHSDSNGNINTRGLLGARDTMLVNNGDTLLLRESVDRITCGGVNGHKETTGLMYVRPDQPPAYDSVIHQGVNPPSYEDAMNNSEGNVI